MSHASPRTTPTPAASPTRVRALPQLTLDQSRVDSNLVFFDCAETGLSAADLSDALRAKGVLIGAMSRHRLRAVTHLDVDAAAVDTAGEALEAVVAAAP